MLAHRLTVAQLLVRNIDEELVRHLKRRAGEHGISAEEEHRRILEAALSPDPTRCRLDFWQALSELPRVGDDELLERDRSQPDRAAARRSLDD